MLLSMMMLMLAAPQEAGGTAEAELSTAPATNPGGWVTNADYPARAMREEREGMTGFKIIIGADGLPKSCEIIASSGHGDLDAATCRLVMERARFTPGRNARGEATGGTHSNRVRWQIPEDEGFAPEPAGFDVDAMQESWPRGAKPEDMMIRLDPAAHYPPAARAAREEGVVLMALSVDSVGRVTGCKVTETSLSATLDAAACALMRSNGKFIPALDGDGKPTKAVVATRFRWELPAEAVAEDAEGVSLSSGRPFPMEAPGSSTLSIVVGTDGRVEDCRFSNTGKFGAMPNGATPCDAMSSRLRYVPFVDAAGKPVAKRVTMRSDLTMEDVAPPGK